MHIKVAYFMVWHTVRQCPRHSAVSAFKHHFTGMMLDLHDSCRSVEIGLAYKKMLVGFHFFLKHMSFYLTCFFSI